MCLLVVAWRCAAEYPLLVAANRDEMHARPAEPLHRWPEGMVGGRDARAGGSWLGVGPAGRFASVTNLHPPAPAPPGAPSRGALVRDFLLSGEGAGDFAERVAREAHRYAGFNLVVADAAELVVVCSRTGKPEALPPGVHGIANEPPGTPTVKVERAAAAVRAWLEGGGGEPEPLFEALADRRPGSAEELAGASPLAPRSLGPPFLVHPIYGTRSSTVVVHEGDTLLLVERRWNALGRPAGEARERLRVAG